MTKRIAAALPAATLAQRIAALSTAQLVDAARALAQRPDGDTACTAVLEALEGQLTPAAFAAFVGEIYA